MDEISAFESGGEMVLDLVVPETALELHWERGA